ncbi:probable deoxyhypusine synthase [Homalodisca vitripennis]|uniref:probable deoxyhypusine synthase n=1 Tax=Homalodisca vitripennis TaxID=197043 RepID=UPI001EEB197E|nr:probable deoxyhypusine synthase [Homalodisca vitripennis]
MLKCRDIPLSEEQEDSLEDDEFIQRKHSCTIFLGYTSNMVSSGVRDTIRFLAEHRLVDCIVTTAGGVEEDLIKCLAPTYIGDFHLKGSSLREKGLNRIGNLLVPNDNYCLFEDWIMPILDTMLEEQKKNVSCLFGTWNNLGKTLFLVRS